MPRETKPNLRAKRRYVQYTKLGITVDSNRNMENGFTSSINLSFSRIFCGKVL